MATPGNDSPHEETCFNRKRLEGCFMDLFHNGDQIVYQDVFFIRLLISVVMVKIAFNYSNH